MDKGFQEFMRITKEGIKNGTIRIEVPKGQEDLNDFDWAVYYATRCLYDKKGSNASISMDEILNELKRFAPELIPR